jgi:hypothetical protein
MISFVTAVKLIQGYEDFASRLKVYIECISEGCRSASIPYEIIVVEDQCRKNTMLVHDFFEDDWLKDRCTSLLVYHANYPNPKKYNMIEAYAKNVGIRAAKHPFVCVTNCDIFFNDAFFPFLRTMKPATFYRFMQYETDDTPPSWKWEFVKGLSHHCINPDLADRSKWNLNTIAYKSGDIMLTDRTTWDKIRGFPENTEWVHSDLVVCVVVSNNGTPLVVPEQVKVLTYPQPRNNGDTSAALKKAEEYISRKTCN